MENKQLMQEIEQRFHQEEQHVVTHSEDAPHNKKIMTILISVTMSVLIISSLVYSLIEAMNQ